MDVEGTLTLPTKDELQSELVPLPEPLEPPEPPNEPAYEEVVGLALRHARGRRGGDLVSVLLVGSGARRAVTAHSDVDLVVLVKGQADSHEIVRVADRTADIRYWGHKEVEEELKRIGHELRPLEIVVVNTRAGSRYGNNDYVNAGCGMGYDATIFLLEKGIRLTGTDAWSWDAPFYWTAQKWAKDHDPSIIWEGHKAGRDIGYCHLEKLHNLEALPGDGFTIACFPHKIRGASAGWTRAVAIFED